MSSDVNDNDTKFLLSVLAIVLSFLLFAYVIFEVIKSQKEVEHIIYHTVVLTCEDCMALEYYDNTVLQCPIGNE